MTECAHIKSPVYFQSSHLFAIKFWEFAEKNGDAKMQKNRVEIYN